MRTLTDDEDIAVKQCILPVIATGRDGSFRPAGTCWIVAIAGRSALAFSAAHIFNTIVRSEGYGRETHPTTPPFFRPKKRPVSLRATRLKAIFKTSQGSAQFVDIHRVHTDDSFDLALCELEMQNDALSSCVFTRKLSIHSGPVALNTRVAAVGYAGMDKTISSVTDTTAQASMYSRLTFEHGSCISRHPLHGPQWQLGPSFEISVKTVPGMSGGPIFHKGYGDEIVACGLVSHGGPLVPADYGADEVTVAANLWPAYAMQLVNYRDPTIEGDLNLLKLVRRGIVLDKSDGPSHFRWVNRNGDGSGEATWAD